VSQTRASGGMTKTAATVLPKAALQAAPPAASAALAATVEVASTRKVINAHYVLTCI